MSYYLYFVLFFEVYKSPRSVGDMGHGEKLALPCRGALPLRMTVGSSKRARRRATRESSKTGSLAAANEEENNEKGPRTAWDRSFRSHGHAVRHLSERGSDGAASGGGLPASLGARHSARRGWTRGRSSVLLGYRRGSCLCLAQRLRVFPSPARKRTLQDGPVSLLQWQGLRTMFYRLAVRRIPEDLRQIIRYGEVHLILMGDG